MTKTMNHSNCTHPATKAGRAKCRRDRAQAQQELAIALADIKARYFAGDDAEELIYALRAIDPALTIGYYDGTMDIEEIILGACR